MVLQRSLGLDCLKSLISQMYHTVLILRLIRIIEKVSISDIQSALVCTTTPPPPQKKKRKKNAHTHTKLPRQFVLEVHKKWFNDSLTCTLDLCYGWKATVKHELSGCFLVYL